MTYNDILAEIESGKLRYHHTSSTQGYVSRRLSTPNYPVIKYVGKFGRGYKLFSPRYDSTWYCYVTYYVYEE